jgi:ubiquinol-cytochrome c reductase cytochrome b subunit
MFAAIGVLFLLPWLDTSPVRSANYRPLYRMFFYIWLVDVLILGYCGGMPAEEPYVMISQIGTIYYFAFFLIIIPILSKIERTKPLPNSISEAVLGENYEASPIGMETGTPADQARGGYRPGAAHPQPAE